MEKRKVGNYAESEKEDHNIMSTTLNNKSLSLRKKKNDLIHHKTRILASSTNSEMNIEININEIKETFQLVMTEQSPSTLLDIFTSLNTLLSNDISVDYDYCINPELVKVIHNIISSYLSYDNLLIQIISFLSKAIKTPNLKLQLLFLPNDTNYRIYLINYYHLLTFSSLSNHQDSYINILKFFRNLITDSLMTQNSFLLNYQEKSHSIIKAIHKDMDITMETNLEILYAQISFFSSFSKINYYDNPDIFIMIFPMVTFIISNKDFYYNSKNDILYSAVWGSSYLALTTKIDHLHMFYEQGLIETLYIIGDIDNKFLTPVIKIFGNLLSNTTNYVRMLIDKGIIDYFIKHLSTCHSENKEKIMWALSNMTAESSAHDDLFDKNVFQILMDILNAQPSYNLIKEIWWCFQNAFDLFSPVHCLRINNLNILQMMMHFLETWNDHILLIIVLDGLKVLLSKGVIYKNNSHNIFLEVFNKNSGKELLQKLCLSNKHQHIVTVCNGLLKLYFENDIAMDLLE